MFAVKCVVACALLVCVVPVNRAQSAADLQTLADLKTAARQMQLESEGAVPFRMEATVETSDLMGRPENQGHWTEEFARPGAGRRTVDESASPDAHAPKDQANMGPPTPTMSGTFMQRTLIDAMLRPGPTDGEIDQSKTSYKRLKIGPLSLRCVLLEPLGAKTNHEKQGGMRGYCLAEDKPVIRFAELPYEITVSYNSLARFGDRIFAEQVTASQRGRSRGKLQVIKLVSAPELLHASLPELETALPAQSHGKGVVLVRSSVMAGQILNKVQPRYTMQARRDHVSGTVVMSAIISREGRVENLEVISAPSDDLAASAVDAVSQWTYKPYLLNGQPTEVGTTVTVDYSTSH